MACGHSRAQQAIPVKSVLTQPVSNVELTEKAQSLITSYTDIRSGNVTYISGGLIDLKPGFHVGEGAVFQALIEPESAKLNDEKLDSEAPIFKASPNPFISNTEIEYYLNEQSNVSLSIINLNGVEVSRPISNKVQPRGIHRINFESKLLPSGFYTCILETPTVKKAYKVFKQ